MPTKSLKTFRAALEPKLVLAVECSNCGNIRGVDDHRWFLCGPQNKDKDVYIADVFCNECVTTAAWPEHDGAVVVVRGSSAQASLGLTGITLELDPLEED